MTHQSSWKLSTCQLCRHWWHRRLLLWQPTMPLVTIKFSHFVITSIIGMGSCHDDVIKWKHFRCYWPFCAGNSQVPGEFPTQSQWRRALIISLICASINNWVNNGEAGDLRRHRAHYDVRVMSLYQLTVDQVFLIIKPSLKGYFLFFHEWYFVYPRTNTSLMAYNIYSRLQ